ncbi:hypothetical protein SLE2022_151270 [Rubroshorea leprosula]
MINSVGIWGYLQNTENIPLVYALPRLELQILLAFFVTHSLHFIFKRIGLPIFVSQLLTELILGTAVQNMNADFQKIMLSFGSKEILDVTAPHGCEDGPQHGVSDRQKDIHHRCYVPSSAAAHGFSSIGKGCKLLGAR